MFNLRTGSLVVATSIVICATTLALDVSPSPPRPASTATDGLSLSVECPKQAISGTAIPFTVSITNDTGGDILYVPNTPIDDLTLTVKRDNRAIQSLDLYKSWETRDVDMRAAPIAVKTGAGLKIELNLARLFDCSVPGTYEITAEWNAKSAKSGKEVTANGSGRLRIDAPDETSTAPK